MLNRTMHKGIFLGVLGSQVRDIEIFDKRFEGPYISIENGNQEVLYQNIDTFTIDGKSFDVFKINQVSVNISISNKYCIEAEVLYSKLKTHIKEENISIDIYDRTNLVKLSKELCDYIEAIEKAIIFAYTSIESFVNLSIPQNYKYINEEKRGIKKEYDIFSIQRYLDLKTKLKK